jgi:hypothetical protein
LAAAAAKLDNAGAGFVEIAVQLARRVVADVEQRDVLGLNSRCCSGQTRGCGDDQAP